MGMGTEGEPPDGKYKTTVAYLRSFRKEFPECSAKYVEATNSIKPITKLKTDLNQ